MALLSGKRTILVKIESQYGTDPTPDGSDVLRVRSLDVTPLDSEVVQRDLIRPYLGNSDQILSSVKVRMAFQVELGGSGTAATSPRFGALLKACGFAETTTANAVTGNAQAGGAGTITLASGASATNGAYVGMVLTITGGTGANQVGLITNYVGSSKVATVKAITSGFTAGNDSVYSIAANVKYTPVSSSFSSVTIYFNNDGVLHKSTGCRGTFSLGLTAGGIPTIDFDMMGLYVAPSDVAAPSVTYSNQATPVIVNSDNTKAFSLLGYSGCMMNASLQMANEMIYRELVNCTKEILITNRAPSGEVQIEAPTIAAKDYFTDALANDGNGLLSMIHGTVAGNRMSLIAPSVDIGNPTYADQDGIQMLNLPYVAVPTTAGNDEVTLTFC